MSYNNSQESTINTQDISKGFIEFLMNGELDEMVSLITYNIYIYIKNDKFCSYQIHRDGFITIIYSAQKKIFQ